MTESERRLFLLLRGRYPADRWGLFPQVRLDTWSGFAADAIAVALWASLGPAVHGFEFKASRGDWRRELRAPGKADVVGRFCNYWWLVTPDLSIAREVELPDGWGWLSGEKPKRTQAEQLRLERRVHREQVAFSFLADGAEPDPSPPPRPEASDVRTLWTVRPAAKRPAPPPDWLLVACVLRRAQSEMAARSGTKIRDGLLGRSRLAVVEELG